MLFRLLRNAGSGSGFRHRSTAALLSGRWRAASAGCIGMGFAAPVMLSFYADQKQDEAAAEWGIVRESAPHGTDYTTGDAIVDGVADRVVAAASYVRELVAAADNTLTALLAPAAAAAAANSSTAAVNPTDRSPASDLERMLEEAMGQDSSILGGRGSGGVPDMQLPRREPSPGLVACSKLLLANVLVYGAWWVVPENVMMEWFSTSALKLVNSPVKGLFTAFSCAFSHRELWHLGMNMMGLMSFGPKMVDGKSTPQAPKMTPTELYVFYGVTGVVSSLASSLLNVFLRVPNPSLGASGALFAVLGYHTMSHPDSRILIMFIINVSAEQVGGRAGGRSPITCYDSWNACVRYCTAVRVLGKASLCSLSLHLRGVLQGLATLTFASYTCFMLCCALCRASLRSLP